MTKWAMWALLFWLGVAVLSAGAEYLWIGDAEASKLKHLWEGWNIFAAIFGGIGLVATFIAGARGARLVTLGAGLVVIVALRDIMTFNYPTIFYGSYEIFRWIILLIMLAIFIIPVLWSLISQGTSSS